MPEQEFTFPNPETGGELTIYCNRVRHPSKIIGVGNTIDSAVEDAEKQIRRIMYFGDYQHVQEGNGTIVQRNGRNFYVIPDITLYRGIIIWH